MNKTVIITTLTIAACGLSSTAWAAPVATYNEVTGGIYFQNDHTGPLANVSIISLSGSLRDASWLLNIPGAVKDDSELPFAFTYLGLPVGQTFAGFIVRPSPPVYDLQFEYRLDSLTEPLKRGQAYTLDQLPPFPEPTSCSMAVVSALAFVAAARRRGRN